MQQSEGVSWGVADDIGRILLSRPERANSLTLAASRALVRAIDEVLERKPRVVLLAAQGRIFCAGGNIDEFAAAGTALDKLVDDILTPLHPALYRLATAPLPVVAAVSGPVAGAGIGLALCADFVLGAASTTLRTGYAAIGLSPDAGASYFLARRVGAMRAQQWLMLSETIDAQRCLQHGVIDALYPDDGLADAAEALVARLASAAGGSLAAIKTLCGGLPARGLQEHLALEQALLVARAGSADAREGVRAFLEKRPPRFAGGQAESGVACGAGWHLP
ncbi:MULTISPECIES: enoyl-CoA hydratase/isomerase family protein [Cupriavidus]|uniref:enoyl-CoA hydratase/isomerase family protein n=1 Tax=Cupriavidus TaxID=106589 RepID=UPI00044CA728|nr:MULTISPECIES: enoyl-CoA hydratase-related protein [Cupriavidus]KDP86095.1 enoyl-CoA hydratase [Cupriavidus sp. SK-3]MDF3889185.1 enoyl-CoA hydratase-related protein [Cupriavidus basilensis]